MPEIPPGHIAQQHPVYQRIRTMFGFPEFPEDVVRRARAAYYGLITYLDEKIGQLLNVLDETGQRDNTVIVHVSDHGEMNGEHGMWRKSNFYEASARIPAQIVWPGHITPGTRIPQVMSLVDVVATIVDIAGAEPVTPLDGDSLLPLLRGDSSGWKDAAFAEYLAHGVDRPMAMLRQGRYKLNYSLNDPPELYDLEADPGEFHNLADDPQYREILDALQAALLEEWDPAAIDQQVRLSQRERLLLEAATGQQWRGLNHAAAPPEWQSPSANR
jgi:choline-sulfatase